MCLPSRWRGSRRGALACAGSSTRGDVDLIVYGGCSNEGRVEQCLAGGGSRAPLRLRGDDTYQAGS